MTDYTPITDFSIKDSLSTGDDNKLIIGASLDSEFAPISTAIASKAEGTATAIEISKVSWTPTWTGFSTDPSTSGMTSWRYNDGTRSFVWVVFSTALTGTSNANTFTITGIPSALRPDATVISSGFIAVGGNGTTVDMALASITAAGVITFLVMGTNDLMTSTGWATTGSKGFVQDQYFLYPLVVTA